MPLLPRAGTTLDRRTAISLIVWALIGLGIILGINMAIILIRGFWQPVQILLAMSGLTFFETGFFLLIGGMALMLGGFPSLGKALQKDWTPQKGKETRELSYIPLMVAGLLFLVSVLTSLAVYGIPL
ncbi:MAG: hypothetical protein ACFE89_03020 [Candidatus Hodarchaeota archaeon]